MKKKTLKYKKILWDGKIIKGNPKLSKKGLKKADQLYFLDMIQKASTLFTPECINWEHPKIKKAIKESLEFSKFLKS